MPRLRINAITKSAGSTGRSGKQTSLPTKATHIRTAQAAVALEGGDIEADFHQPIPRPSLVGAPQTAVRTYWARNSHRGTLGRCVGIQVRGERLFVGVSRNEMIVWVPADKALSSSEAEAWFARAQFQ